MNNAETSLAEKIARIGAGGPPLTPEQSELISYLAGAGIQRRPDTRLAVSPPERDETHLRAAA